MALVLCRGMVSGVEWEGERGKGEGERGGCVSQRVGRVLDWL